MWRLRQALLLLLLSFSLAQTDPLWSQIFWGHEAKPHSRPYMAALKYPNGIFDCGGFLVAPQWVMTAAHCNGTYRVTLGAHNIHNKEPFQQVFSIAGNYVHPKYKHYYKNNELIIYNDIRLLKLNSKATLNEYVKILRLPTFNRDLSHGTPCSVAGWGLVYTDWSPKTLFETNVTIYDHRECGELHHNIDGGKVCAGSPYKPMTILPGDSGGPLVCNGVAQGIASYFNPSHPPAVYTRVAHYLDWIQETMQKHSQ